VNRSFSALLVCVLLGANGGCGRAKDTGLDSSGNIFVRQMATSLKLYREAFLGQKQALKAHGFEAYSLHRDLKVPHVFILTLQCSDLAEGVSFIRSPEYMAALMNKAGARIPMIWYGLDTVERKYTDQSHMTGGTVMAFNQVRDYPFWLKCFQSENHHHPGRKYKASDYSINHLPGDPAVAIVVHEASNITYAPAFMTSEPLYSEMESTGVVGLEIWYGINVEEGTF
jgi:hypothetical protein